MHPTSPTASRDWKRRELKHQGSSEQVAWLDPDQPGIASPPDAEPGLRKRVGKASHVRAQAPAEKAVAVLAPAHPAPQPKPLGLRKAYWRIAGLAALVGAPLLYALSRNASVLPAPGPGAGTGPLQGSDEASERPLSRLMHEASATLPYEVTDPRAPTPPAHLIEPLSARTLTESIESALTKSNLDALIDIAMGLGGGWSRKGLPLAAVERMVEAYRASRSWRETSGMTKFLDAMINAIGPMRASDEQVKQLLTVWSWRYGEARPHGEKQGPLDINALRIGFAETLATGLGGHNMPASQWRLLVNAVSAEPDDIVLSGISDPVLSAHASWVGDALIMVMVLTRSPLTLGQEGEPGWLAPEALRNCLRQFLQQPSFDPRWKTMVLIALNRGLTLKTQDTLMTIAQWKSIILDTAREHLAESQPQLGPIPNFETAMTALYDPDLLRAGRILGRMTPEELQR